MPSAAASAFSCKNNLPSPRRHDKVGNMKITPQRTRNAVAYPVRALAVAAAAATLSSCDQQVVGSEPDTPDQPARQQQPRGKYIIEDTPAAPAPDPEPQKLPGEPVEAPQKPDDRPDQAVVGLYVKDTPQTTPAPQGNPAAPPTSNPAPEPIPQPLPGDVPKPAKE